MVERAEILSKIASIKSHTWAQEEEPTGDEVWQGRQHGATFKMSKPEGVIFEEEVSILFLKLQGRGRGRDKLRQEFTDVLGDPTIEIPAARFLSQTLTWKL